MKEDLRDGEGEQSMTRLIRAGWVAAWDGTKHYIVEHGEVAFQDGQIVYAGPQFNGHVDTVIDRPEWFVCPGFINLHGHIGMELTASSVDIPRSGRFAPSEEFVRQQPFAPEPSLTPEEQRFGAEFSLVQMLRCGATTIVDAHGSGTRWWLGNPPRDEEMLADIVGRIGSRAYLALGFRTSRKYQRKDGSTGWYEDEDMETKGLQEALDFAEKHRGTHGGRVEAILTAHAAERCSPALLEATLREAQAADLLITIHVAQTLDEVELIRERYGETPVGYLHNNAFLAPNIILGHCVYTSGHPAVNSDDHDRDLKLIADAGSSVAHSPLTFARAGEALHSLPLYLDHGINVGIGCDVWPADIIEEMRLAWFMGKHTNGTADRPTCMEVFTAATVGSANALGRTDLGRLTTGAKADMVCIDLSHYHFGPVLDPVRSLVAFGKGQDVDTIFVDGEEVVTEGHVVNADEKGLQMVAPDVLRSLEKAASERDPTNNKTFKTMLSL